MGGKRKNNKKGAQKSLTQRSNSKGADSLNTTNKTEGSVEDNSFKSKGESNNM